MVAMSTDKDSSDPDRYTVASFAKGLRVLRALGESTEPLKFLPMAKESAREISMGLGYVEDGSA